MSSKYQLLDPMGTLCRLILLNFEPKSTKVTITNHTIQIQTPFSGQWLYRRITGDGVTNIFVLFQVFQRVIEWYIIPLHNKKFGTKSQYDKKKNSIYKINIDDKHKKNKEDDKDIKLKEDILPKQLHLHVEDKDVSEFWDNMVKLCEYVCAALSKLQYTYETDNQIAVIALQYYINMLKEAVDGRYDIEKLPACIVDSKPDNLLDYDKIQNLWDAKKIKELCHLFDLSFSSEGENIEIKDKDTKEVKEVLKNKKIESYLNAINGLLNISDDSFIELIQSSNRG
jgi:hypothetical protein